MSGSASRSQFSRFVKRRLTLLMVKLAIFIGLGRGASASTLALGLRFVRSPSQSLRPRKASYRTRGPIGGGRRKLAVFKMAPGSRSSLSDPVPVPVHPSLMRQFRYRLKSLLRLRQSHKFRSHQLRQPGLSLAAFMGRWGANSAKKWHFSCLAPSAMFGQISANFTYFGMLFAGAQAATRCRSELAWRGLQAQYQHCQGNPPRAV